MKNILTIIFLIVFAVAAVFAALAWYNNICIALQWNPTSGHSEEYHGPISWLDWCGVDFSTVSTFIPFFGFVLITMGLARILLPGKAHEISADYPFFKSYNSITMALGLIGTVYGLIMIGYYQPGRVQMSDLVLCLRTALYSTLVALIWVFPFGIPMKTMMQYFYVKVRGEKKSGDFDVITQLRELGAVSSDASKRLGKTTNSAKRFQHQLIAIKTELLKIGELFKQFREGFDINVIITLKEVCSDMRNSLNQIREESNARKKTVEEQQKALQQLVSQLEKDRQSRKELAALLQKAEEERATANMRLLEKVFEGIRSTLTQREKTEAWSWLGKVRKIVAALA